MAIFLLLNLPFFLITCVNQINTIDKKETSPLTFGLINHYNTQYFGEKSIVYIGNIQSITETSKEPTGPYGTTHTIDVPPKTTDMTYTQYFEIVTQTICSTKTIYIIILLLWKSQKKIKTS
jgi:hypothetical protein